MGTKSISVPKAKKSPTANKKKADKIKKAADKIDREHRKMAAKAAKDLGRITNQAIKIMGRFPKVGSRGK
jgi:hypothetical protein